MREHTTPEEAEDGNDGWARDELRAAVAAYLDMARRARAGTPFTKKKYYQDLSTQYGRTAKAFEFRMQNISYVLALLGRTWLAGLKPAKNVGIHIAVQIEELIAELEQRPQVPVVAFEIEAREGGKGLAAPSGNAHPQPVAATTTSYPRDAKVKAWVLQQAAGVCELCHQPAPFSGPDGLPYLEVHHVRRLADEGPDRIDNAVAICPNCHRELHYGADAPNKVAQLYRELLRLQPAAL